MGCSLWGRKELDGTEQLSAHTHSQDTFKSSVNVFSSCCHIFIVLSTKQLQVFTGNTEALSLSEFTFVSRFSSDSPKPGKPRCEVILAWRAMHRQTCGQGLITGQYLHLRFQVHPTHWALLILQNPLSIMSFPNLKIHNDSPWEQVQTPLKKGLRPLTRGQRTEQTQQKGPS